MKTMKLFLLLAGATLLVAGCNKQNPFGGKYSRKDGNPVVFGVGSRNMETTLPRVMMVKSLVQSGEPGFFSVFTGLTPFSNGNGLILLCPEE